MVNPITSLGAAQLKRRHLLSAVALGATGCLSGCLEPPPTPLRIGAHPWPGYELLYLARARGHLNPGLVRLIEVPSASASLRALASQAMEGAALTLDEVITARARGIKLTVVAVIDESRGADVVLAQPNIRSVQELKGKRIGVETSATGAVMLHALLTRYHLSMQDVLVQPLSIEDHGEAFLKGQVQAVVTYEPVRSRLLAAGAVPLFSSADIPGQIIDTLAVRHEWLNSHRSAVQHLVAAHFRALADWQRDPASCAPQLAPRLGLPAQEVAASYSELDLPNISTNLSWLAQRQGRLEGTALLLSEIMQRAGLLLGPVETHDLFDSGFLPRVNT